jgi:signal peptidase I
VTRPDELQGSAGSKMSAAVNRPRNPWIAGILALLFGTVGQVYCGHLRRAISLCLILNMLCLVVFALLTYVPYGRVALILSVVLALGCWLLIVVDAVRLARLGQSFRRWYQCWWCYIGYYALTTLLGYAAAGAIRSGLSEAFLVPTGSMANTVLPGDQFLVDKLAYRIGPIRRGDIIAFMVDGQMVAPQYRALAETPGVRQTYIKRIIGIPGDTIEIRDEKVFRNGEAIDEPYANFSGELPPRDVAPQLRDTPEQLVPEGQYFLLGDNRRQSYDSRFAGCVDQALIIGKARMIYWSSEMPDPPQPNGGLRWERMG